MYEILWRGMTCTVWQVAESFALSYCKGRFPYSVSGMKIYFSVQEQGDCAIMAPEGSPVKSAPSPLVARYDMKCLNWQGRLHYPAVRVGFLTWSVA